MYMHVLDQDSPPRVSWGWVLLLTERQICTSTYWPKNGEVRLRATEALR